MRLRCFLIGLGLLAIAPTAPAFDFPIEIKTKAMKDLPLAFEIHAQALANGDIQFTFKITERTMKFRDDRHTSLKRIHVYDKSMEIRGWRHLPADRKEDTISCVFVATPAELEDPSASFYFSMPLPDHSNIDHFYAPLRNFMP